MHMWAEFVAGFCPRGGEWLMRDFARPRDLGFSLRARGILTFYVARARL